MFGPRKDENVQGLRDADGRLEDRREIRYELPIEIEVSGIDQNGKVFHELTFTKDASEWGCAFLSSLELKIDDIISLRVSSPGTRESSLDRQSLFQVRRVAEGEGGRVVGAWKMDSGDVWGIDLKKNAHREAGAQESRQDDSAKRSEEPRKETGR